MIAIPRRTLTVPAFYLLVVAVSAAVPFIFDSATAGIWAILVTLPWPMLVIAVANVTDPALLDGPLVGLGGVIVGGLINAAVMYYILRRSRREA